MKQSKEIIKPRKNWYQKIVTLFSAGLLVLSSIIPLGADKKIYAQSKDTPLDTKKSSVKKRNKQVRVPLASGEKEQKDELPQMLSDEETTSVKDPLKEGSETVPDTDDNQGAPDTDIPEEQEPSEPSQPEQPEESKPTLPSEETPSITKPDKPKPEKPKPDKPKPSADNDALKPQLSLVNKTDDNGQAKPVDKTEIQDGSIAFLKNQTTAEFIQSISKEASLVAQENNLYASVMIAQAILESGSGNSTLSAAPNYNLFGIKGTFKGQSVSMGTMEDAGNGSLYGIQSNFRKYSSYKESLEDYARLLSQTSFYQGTWKSNTTSYKDATKYLTGRYATDTKYNQKLNGLIETYDLQQYDQVKKVTKTFKVTKHIVAEKETIWDVAKKYGIPIKKIKHLNQMDEEEYGIKVGSELVVKREEITDHSKESKDKVVSVEETRQIKQVEHSHDLVLLKAKQVGLSMTRAVPSTLYKDPTYNVLAKRMETNQTYRVKKNDTLKSISKSTNISVKHLMEWNNLTEKILTEGQTLTLTSPYLVGI